MILEKLFFNILVINSTWRFSSEDCCPAQPKTRRTNTRVGRTCALTFFVLVVSISIPDPKSPWSILKENSDYSSHSSIVICHLPTSCHVVHNTFKFWALQNHVSETSLWSLPVEKSSHAIKIQICEYQLYVYLTYVSSVLNIFCFPPNVTAPHLWVWSFSKSSNAKLKSVKIVVWDF